MNITLDDGRTELWQWDTGRKIVVDDKSVSEVHYSKYSSTQAITREVIDGKAEIPNFLLQDTHAVTVYAYSGSIENGYTVAEKTFNVAKKPKPANYVETEEDKAILAKLKAAIGDLSELQTEAKDNLVSAINEAAASGGADWAQNNPDGDGYIKNRPGGYMTDPVITDVDTFTITSAEDQGGIYFTVVAVESSTITLSDYTIGDSVIVDFGGQSYSLTWQSIEGMPACGAAVTEEGPDWSAAPFCIMAVFGGDGGLRGYYVYLQNAVTSPIQVKLTMAKQTPVKIPEKYLDLDGAKEITLFTISYNQSSKAYESDRTYDELKAALDAGKTVLAKFRNVMGEFYNYGLLYQRAMYVPGIWVYVGGSDPCEWQCAEGNKWTKRQLLSLSTGIGEPKKAGTAAYGTSEYASRDDHVHPSELPTVSADDDGKLLGVTGGAWGKVDKPSGGGAITYDIAATAERSVQNNTLQGFTCSVSSKQLRKAIDTGKTPRLVIKIRTTTMYMPMTNYFLVGAEYAYVNFGCVDEYGLENVVCDGESEVDAGKPIWLAHSSFVTPTY